MPDALDVRRELRDGGGVMDTELGGDDRALGGGYGREACNLVRADRDALLDESPNDVMPDTSTWEGESVREERT